MTSSGVENLRVYADGEFKGESNESTGGKFYIFIKKIILNSGYIKKKIESIPTTVLKFWVGTRFCDTDKRQTTNDERRTTNDERQTTPLRITIL